MDQLNLFQNHFSQFDPANLRAAFYWKIFLLLVVFFYFFYALAVIKQVSVMNRVLETDQAGVLKKLALFHWLATAVAFLIILIFT